MFNSASIGLNCFLVELYLGYMCVLCWVLFWVLLGVDVGFIWVSMLVSLGFMWVRFGYYVWFDVGFYLGFIWVFVGVRFEL